MNFNKANIHTIVVKGANYSFFYLFQHFKELKKQQTWLCFILVSLIHYHVHLFIISHMTQWI